MNQSAAQHPLPKGLPSVEEAAVTDLWLLHPQGAYFLEQGGDEVPPPRHANLTLTNKCNLRCEICGSQKTLDLTKTQRHHMPIETFRKIAETVFPFMYEVELNSQGDPLLYPHIDEVLETLNKNQCLFRIQHNGTLLSDSIIEKINDGYGTVSLSLDAVGPRLDEVRRGAQWERAEPGLRKLAATRDPRRVALWLYPTVTNRTVHDMFDVVKWAHENKVDYVLFHDYDQVQGSSETFPDKTIKAKQIEKIIAYLEAEQSDLGVNDNDGPVYKKPRGGLRRENPNPYKAKFCGGPNSPLEQDNPQASPTKICAAPWQSLDIGIDGQICACCRSQYYPFGAIDGAESFAAIWLGENFRKLRESVMRDGSGKLPLPSCAGCIKSCAPVAGRKVFPIPYKNNLSEHPLAFQALADRIPLSLLFRERAGSPVFSARVPLGLNPDLYDLYEDDRKLGPVCSHGDIMKNSHGRYGYGPENILYFAASDDSEPLRNGRTYELRRKS